MHLAAVSRKREPTSITADSSGQLHYACTSTLAALATLYVCDQPTCHSIQTSLQQCDKPLASQCPDQLQLYANPSQAELKKGKEEIQRLKAALLDQEGAVLHRERQLADLKRQLKEERRKGEAPLQMDQAIQADPVQCADLQVQAWDAALTAPLWSCAYLSCKDSSSIHVSPAALPHTAAIASSFTT